MQKLPRLRAPRLRAPRLRAPRLRAPRLRAPRLRAPRLRTPRLPTLLVPAVVLPLIAVPAAAQDIPDVPGESLADRTQERFVERDRGFLSRIFTTGSFDAGRLPRDGLGYQPNVSVGLDFRSGDAMFPALNSCILPDRDPQYFDNESLVVYAGVGYTLSGTRFLGSSEAGQRSVLSTEVGVWSGEASLVATGRVATYEILRFAAWAAGSVLLGLGTAAVHSTLIARVDYRVPPDDRAAAVGTYRLWRDLGYVAGGIGVGLAVDLAGLRGAVLVVAAVTAGDGRVGARRLAAAE